MMCKKSWQTVVTLVHKELTFNLFQGRGYSSVVEHSTADREAPGSIPGAPFFFSCHVYVYAVYYINFTL